MVTASARRRREVSREVGKRMDGSCGRRGGVEGVWVGNDEPWKSLLTRGDAGRPRGKVRGGAGAESMDVACLSSR